MGIQWTSNVGLCNLITFKVMATAKKKKKKKISFYKSKARLIKSSEIWYLFIQMFGFFYLSILTDVFNLTKSILPLKYFFFFCYLISRFSSQHKLKFWTGIRQKIRCEMVLVGMYS